MCYSLRHCLQTAFHGYQRTLLTDYSVPYGTDEGLPALFAKHHDYYDDTIQAADVVDRVKNILRSAGGMINAVNELRNNNIVLHPNGQVIQVRK